ncbi:MAG: hypothetical protein ND895_07485 [Pyrinomonadaceae bacterium]|nr:hypothetical protein [Pyrinomonadaceae bacterium]
MRSFNGQLGFGRHLMSAACLLFVLASTTSAYSIVMRGGKRIEIPAQFSVTNMTLTYESAPGFWITLQMAAIDITATERVNNEMPGSLLGRATREVAAPKTSVRTSQALPAKASRTVTNLDLESFKHLRLKSERAYEQRLKDQGLPPMAVLRAQAEADAKRFSLELAQQRTAAEANERAAQIQAQIAALSVQLNNLQSRSSEPSYVYPDAFTYYGGFPYFGGRSRVNPALFRVPSGLPIGGAFGSFNAQFGSYRPGRIIVAPGTQFGGHGGFRGGHHGSPRSR